MTVQELITFLQKVEPHAKVEVLTESSWPRSIEIVGVLKRQDLPETRLAGRGHEDILLVCHAQLGPVGAV